MKKLLAAIIITLGMVAPYAPVYAEESEEAENLPSMLVTTQENCEEGGQDECVVPLSDEPAGGYFDEPDEWNVPEQTIDNVLSEDNCSPDMNCISSAEKDDEEESEESEEAAEVWPMYVSLGALGAAILIFIILNIVSGKKK